MNNPSKKERYNKNSDLLYINIAFFLLCIFVIFVGGIALSNGLDIPLYITAPAAFIMFFLIAWFKGKLQKILVKKSMSLIKILEKNNDKNQ